MKKVFLAASLIVFAAAALAAFAKRSDDVKVQVNKQVTTKGLTIEFVELVEDSRCPEDVQCVWAGNAKIKVRVTKGDKSELVQLEMVNEGTGPNFGDHRLTLKDLDPKLRSNVRINRNAYVATIEVKKVT